MYAWRICSYYEFARECKFLWYCINQNQPPNLLLEARAEPTNSNSWIAFRRDKIVRDKSTTDISKTKSLSKKIQLASIKQWRHTIHHHLKRLTSCLCGYLQLAPGSCCVKLHILVECLLELTSGEFDLNGKILSLKKYLFINCQGKGLS